MLLNRVRYVQIVPFLCAVCHLTLGFPAQTPSAYDDIQYLQVNIPHSGIFLASLGSSITIPCLMSLSSTPTSSSPAPVIPRIKWTVVYRGVETQILVARGQRVKVNEAYRDRASLLNYTSTPDDLSLWLGDLRPSDTGHYRCEVQQGLEDASDLVQLKIKGVVFHYRDALGRYAFSFHQAQRACEVIGAQIATPDQLLAAYYDGYEQCDAGWLEDQSVRYPIQVPRKGCYGDMDGQPGVRNYGTMDATDLYDVYCYLEQMNGEVFHDPTPQKLSFHEAQSYCRAAGAQLATTAQLYMAWSEGFDCCSPGWLSDGSVRYPIITPRDRCGGPQAGVKTVYRFSNQTIFPEPSSLYDVYCFRDNTNTSSDNTVDYKATKSEDHGHDVVVLMGSDQEMQLSQNTEQVEREAQSLLESFLFSSGPSTEINLGKTHPTFMSDTSESPFGSTSTVDQPFDKMLPSKAMSQDSQHPTAQMTSTINSTETYHSPQNSSLVPTHYNKTDTDQFFHQSELESTTGFPETNDTQIHNQTVPDEIHKENTQPSEHVKQMQESIFNFNTTHVNFIEMYSNHTQDENIQLATPLTIDPMKEALAEPVLVSLSTPSSKGEEELFTQSTQTTQSPDEPTSFWIPLDGSGDISQESDLEVEAVNFIPTSESSTSNTPTHQTPSASASGTPDQPLTSAMSPTTLSGPGDSNKLGLDIYPTSTQLWQSISSQEGSTSLESEDTVTLERDEKLPIMTRNKDNSNFGASLPTTVSTEGLITPELPTAITTAQYETSGYRVAFEEASGHEADIVGTTVKDHIKVASTLDYNAEVRQIFEEEVKMERITHTPTFGEEAKGASIPEEEGKVAIFLEKKTKATPTFEEDVTHTPTFGEEANVVPILEEEANITSTFQVEAFGTPIKEEEAKGTTILEEDVTHTLTSGEEAEVVPILEEEGKFAQTLEKEAEATQTFQVEVKVTHIPEMEAKVTPIPEEEAKGSPILEEDVVNIPTSGEEAEVVPIIEEEHAFAPTIEEEAEATQTFQAEVKVTQTPDDEAKVTSTFEEEVIDTQILEEELRVVPTFQEEDKGSPIPEEEVKGSPIFGEEAKVTPNTDEEHTVVQTFEEEAESTPVPEEEHIVVQTFEEEAEGTPVPEEEHIVVQTFEEEAEGTPVPEEEHIVVPTFEEEAKGTSIIEEEHRVIPTFEEEAQGTLIPEEERRVVPTFEEEAKGTPLPEEEHRVVQTIEEEAIGTSVIEEEHRVVPNFEEGAEGTPIPEEERKFVPTFEEEAKGTSTFEVEVPKTIEEKVTVSTAHEEKVSPTFEVEVPQTSGEDVTGSTTHEDKVNPTSEEEFSVFSLNSETSDWPRLTTTHDFEFSRRTSSITSTVPPDSSSSTEPSSATTKTTTNRNTTHWSKHNWSPTTSTPTVFQQTAEPQKVTAIIPPVDHGLGDVDFSLNQPPTLLILPNERAAVGGTGKVSDACLTNPCLNGGTCTDRDGQIQCLCLPTYGGDFCRMDLERCEPGWDKFHGFCYRHFSQRLSWEVAEQHCRMLGAHLVSIMTPEEQSYINDNYKEYQWTGLNDKTIEDDFRWSDGNPLLYENWYRGQPDSYFLSGEDCVVMVWHDDGRWSDVPCNYHLAYTCKKGTSACGPPPKVRNASIFGKPRVRYETNAFIRYRCAQGFQQRLNPLIRCLSGGRWERPQILCTLETAGLDQDQEVTSSTDSNSAAFEYESVATKEPPQYWDIKF